MSRCFPYPPPGYERNGVSGQALIELLKKLREKAKKESRKEKTREKKKIANGKFEKGMQSHEKRDKGDERSKTCQKSAHHQKRGDDEVAHLEKSSLTEEFEQPISSQNLYDSSDNTKNCNKRRKQSSLPDGSHHGTISRIQLPEQMHRDPEGLFGKNQPCSSSGSMDEIALGKFEIAPRISQEQSCSTSTRIAVSQKVETATTFSSKSGPIQSETQFREFLDNWVPPPIPIECTDFDDQELLFETKYNHRRKTKRVKADNEASCCRSPAFRRYGHMPFTCPRSIYMCYRIQYHFEL